VQQANSKQGINNKANHHQPQPSQQTNFSRKIEQEQQQCS